jgi:phospholipid-transporting ATPase
MSEDNAGTTVTVVETNGQKDEVQKKMDEIGREVPGRLTRGASYAQPRPKAEAVEAGPDGKPKILPNGLRRNSTSLRAAALKLVNRIVYVNDEPRNEEGKYADNVIKTSKYNIITFLPLNLFEQFRRIANFYFLFILLIQLIPDISPFPIASTAAPLGFIIFVTMAKDGFEDFKRHREDAIANSKLFLRLNTGAEQFEKTPSQELKVGSILKINKNEDFPTDCIILLSSKADNTCYVSTAELDGEVTPKVRAAINVFKSSNEMDLVRLRGTLTTVPPNKSLYGFEGTLSPSDLDREMEKKPLGDENVVYRGSKLINTDWVCVFTFATGRETKLMLNRSPRTYKFTEFERLLNKCVILSLCLQIFVNGFIATGTTIVWEWPELKFASSAYTWGYNFVTAFILFSYMIPIALYVSMEFVKLGQAKIMENDDHLSITTTLQTGETVKQTMKVKSSNQVDDLGMIEYVFTDKTGTLTRNQMELSQVSIDGQIFYNDEIPAFEDKANESVKRAVTEIFTKNAEVKEDGVTGPLGVDVDIARQFFFNQAVNNSLVPKVKGHAEGDDKQDADALNSVDPMTMGYLGESPDEISLAEALRANGLFLQCRVSDMIRVRTLNGQQQIFDFTVYGMLKFSSDRKRMSVVARCPDGQYRLYTKGADAKVVPLTRNDTPDDARRKDTAMKQLLEFAHKGSRTLVFASKVLSDDEFKSWKSQYDEASTSLVDREKKIEASFVAIEKEMTLNGCTAVDDQLQNGVPEAVESLIDANIVIMVLTGDKQETAVSIGKASRIIRPGSKLLYVNADNEESVSLILDDIINDYKMDSPEYKSKEFLAMVIDGFSMEIGVTKLHHKFMTVFLKCSTIVCNRATPSQKALIVATVKDDMKKMCLAIGDGANDVSMIQTAQVGVGIQGKEGAQAALTADFVLHRFRHLNRLIFVHGRYSYLRATRVVCFQFYKNTFFPMPMFWYSIFSGYTSQPLYDSYILTLFNVIFTGLPPITIGWHEKDISEGTALLHPQAFAMFRKHRRFNMKQYGAWMALGLFHSVLTYFFSHGIYTQDVLSKDGKVCGLYCWGNLSVAAAIILINGVYLIYTFQWNALSVWSSALGILGYFATYLLFGSSNDISPDLYGSLQYFFGIGHTYFYLIFICVVGFAPPLVFNL